MAETATPTLHLSDFLLARIAEDERRIDTIPDWYCTDSARGEGWGSRGDCELCSKYMFDGTEDVTEEAFWEHMEETHNRARVLAECAALRRIVHRHTVCSVTALQNQPCSDLRDLGTIYADHPDYREEWRR